MASFVFAWLLEAEALPCGSLKGASEMEDPRLEWLYVFFSEHTAWGRPVFNLVPTMSFFREEALWPPCTWRRGLSFPAAPAVLI